MNRKTKLGIAFLALASAAASPAFARDRGDRDERREMRFERADADNSGDISFEEFTAAMGARLDQADGDKDGKVTLAEMTEAVEKARAERMAKRMMTRFDTNGDGVLDKAEVESRQQKIFSYLDRNNDGKLVMDEMPRGKRR